MNFITYYSPAKHTSPYHPQPDEIVKWFIGDKHSSSSPHSSSLQSQACFIHTYKDTYTHQQNHPTQCAMLTATGNEWRRCQFTYPFNHMVVDHVWVSGNESLQHTQLVGLVD